MAADIHFHIISAVPGLLESAFSHSIMERAKRRGHLALSVYDLREYGIGPHRQIDDYQYGGGAGMVMKPEPLFACIEAIKQTTDLDEIIFLCPDGEVFNQRIANALSLKGNIALICGHYKGIDQRIRDHLVTRELSIGDYVLSGGELAATVIVDAVTRLVPGVLNDESSALTDSFQDDLLAAPVYTRPAEFNGWKVPDILLTGNDALIDEWRFDQSLKHTQARRPDLLEDSYYK